MGVTDSGSVAKTFNASFTSGVKGGAGTPQCVAWNAFRASLAAAFMSKDVYSKVTIKGSMLPAGVSCTGPSANRLCMALELGSPETASCDGKTWRVGQCGPFMPGPAMEIAVETTSTCACNTPAFSVRPCMDSENWGGVNTTNCSPPSQTITVTCE